LEELCVGGEGGKRRECVGGVGGETSKHATNGNIVLRVDCQLGNHRHCHRRRRQCHYHGSPGQRAKKRRMKETGERR